MGSLGNKTNYNAYYGDFRGVDFSSDHTQVAKQRLAYAVNMYKDYQSGQGQALETIPGFRRRVQFEDSPTVYGIHKLLVREDGEVKNKIIIHAGNKLYLWYNYPLSLNVEMSEVITLPAVLEVESGLNVFQITLRNEVGQINKLSIMSGERIYSYTFDPDTKILTIKSSSLVEGDNLYLSYFEGVIGADDALFDGMSCRRSASFIFNNRLYLVDGKNYLVYDGDEVKNVLDNAYIPTTYINIIPEGENADIGKEYEARNILQPKFKSTFIADGETTEFFMNENELEEICEVKVYGENVNDYEADLSAGKITFAEAPKNPIDEGYTEFYAGVEITAKKTFKSVSGITGERENIYEMITECTLPCIFDNRVFFTGNPAYPNHVFYCGRNITGYVDPSYFGIYNYMQDGVGLTPITGIIPVADTLMVLKADTQQDGSVFFHTPVQTGEDLVPVTYPATQGLSGIGCLGACINFLDDPVFVSRLGVEGIGQYTSAKYERSIEHRSSLIDAKLVNLNLSNAVLAEWNGYLLVLVDGKMFLADSRQKYTHDIGVTQYEWYYVEGVGTYDEQYTEFKYSERLYSELEGTKVKWCADCMEDEQGCTCGGENFIELPLQAAEAVYNYDIDTYEDLRGTVANLPDEEGKSTKKIYSGLVEYVIDGVNYQTTVDFAIHEIFDRITGDFLRYEAYLCESRGNKTGGVFRPAVDLKIIDQNIFFGTESGCLCSFNFDMRDKEGFIAPRYYNFDERIIVSGCATKMDNCDIPHLTKSTVKKSTVVKTKSMQTSAAKIRVRTNKKPYEQIARINSAMFSFDNMDFSEFSFIMNEQSLFAVKEKEKKWVEKQYYIYSDEYMKPFALYYLCYRYTIAGRYKE